MAILPIGQFPFPNLCNLCSISPQLGSYLSLSDAQEAAAPSLRWQEKLPRHLRERRSSRLYTYTPTYTHLYTYTPTSTHLYTYNLLPKTPPPPRRTHLDTHMCPQIQQPPPHYLESPWHLDQLELI